MENINKINYKIMKEPDTIHAEFYEEYFNKFSEKTLATKIKSLENESTPILNKDKIHFIRFDGRHFKSFCSGFKKPFDTIFREAMRSTMLDMCNEIEGTFIGYTQSDEITIGFYVNENNCIPFNGRKNKIITLASASCTLSFNKNFKEEVERAKVKMIADRLEESTPLEIIKSEVEHEMIIYTKKYE